MDGLSFPQGKLSGGIKNIYLIRSDTIISAVYTEEYLITDFILTDGARFAPVSTEPRNTYLRITTRIDGSRILYVHNISLGLRRYDHPAAVFIGQAQEMSVHGIAALITLNNGVTVLAGYNPRSSLDCSLGISAVGAESGIYMDDGNIIRMELCGYDTYPVWMFAGNIEKYTYEQ